MRHLVLPGNQEVLPRGRRLPWLQEIIADSQLDLIFAIAHDEGRNPVSVSRSGDIPEAGTIEAERALGRHAGPKSGDGVPRKRRMSSGKGNTQKVEQSFAEDAARQA
jgi:hypothetical protein